MNTKPRQAALLRASEKKPNTKWPQKIPLELRAKTRPQAEDVPVPAFDVEGLPNQPKPIRRGSSSDWP